MAVCAGVSPGGTLRIPPGRLRSCRQRSFSGSTLGLVRAMVVAVASVMREGLPSEQGAELGQVQAPP